VYKECTVFVRKEIIEANNRYFQVKRFRLRRFGLYLFSGSDDLNYIYFQVQRVANKLKTQILRPVFFSCGWIDRVLRPFFL